ncbi:ChuX/HutX family heme-like substrate-binding protein [Glaciimonas sp. GG7]
MTTSTRTSETWRDAFLETKTQQKLRNRDAAAAIGISEGEALAACIGSDGAEVIRLKPDSINLFEEVPQLGPVMALSRNDSAVHKIFLREHSVHAGATPISKPVSPSCPPRLRFPKRQTLRSTAQVFSRPGTT